VRAGSTGPRRRPPPPEPAVVEAQVANLGGFERKRAPGPHDWLARFDEAGQSFEEYRGSRPVRAGAGDVLAFLPVGPFTDAERAVFDKSVAFARIWFDLPARVLDARPLPRRGWQRERGWGKQYRTGYFLRNLLPDNMPPDAICLFGVTMADLYPDENWNFVFGEASLRGRVGVWSYARFFAAFAGMPETEATRRRALRRGCQLVVHEAGHAFGMEHCIEYECVMNGSNSLRESDTQPLHLCPVCLKKLAWNRGFDIAGRYGKLLAFFEKENLEEERAWVAARLESSVISRQSSGEAPDDAR
jgi:archaemetzincin